MYGTIDRIPLQPRWGRLYALATVMLTVLGVVEALVPAGPWRRALEIAVTVLGFSAIHLWVCANRRALDLAGARDTGFRTFDMPTDHEMRSLEADMEVTGSDAPDSKRGVGAHGRRRGRRWTSSISA